MYTLVCATLDNLDTIMQNKTVKTAFAHIFCLLIGSLEDINSSVSQRAFQYLETIKTSSIKVTCDNLKMFDLVVSQLVSE